MSTHAECPLPSPVHVLCAHGLCCMLMMGIVSWALLCPDPYHVLRNTSLRPAVTVDDFLQHIATFTVLSITCLSFFHRFRLSSGAVFIGLLLYASGTELLQSQIPGRSADVMDLIANILGIATAAICVRITVQFAELRSRDNACASGAA